MARASSRSLANFNRERELLTTHAWVIGLDEAGRGACAGPLVASACAFSMSTLQSCEDIGCIPQDSKAFSPTRREALRSQMENIPVSVGYGVISAQEINDHGMAWAAKEVFYRALVGMESFHPAFVLVDAVRLDASRLPEWVRGVESVVHGDALHSSIAAASIFAKTHRDRMMVELSHEYPQYGFEVHKGYGTALHIATLRTHGMCPEHRVQFVDTLLKE